MLKLIWQRINRAWKKLECLMYGHDLETKEYDIWLTFNKCQKVTCLVCRHCGKAFMK